MQSETQYPQPSSGPDSIQSGSASQWRVGTCRVDVLANRIARNGAEVEVEPRVMQVLHCLMERPNTTVTYKELHDRIWTGIVVEDDSLRRSVYLLRKALGDVANEPRYIVTIRKTGYRLIAPVVREEISQDRESSHSGPQSLSTGRSKRAVQALFFLSIFVLGVVPLVNKSLDRPDFPVNSEPLTTSPGIEVHPALSPDGVHLAYVAPDEEGMLDLMLLRIGESEPWQIKRPATSENAPAWSPDGSRIAFLRRADSPEQNCSIVTATPRGENEHIEWDCSGDVYAGLDWSPDGRLLAFSVRQTVDEPFKVVLYEIETGKLRFLSEPALGIQGDVRPAFSPDGESLAFVRLFGGRAHDLFVQSLDNDRSVRLTRDSVLVAGFDWSPDSNELIFSSNRAGNFKLWSVGVQGDSPTVWIPSPATYDPGSPSISSNGLMAFEEWSFDYNIARVSLSESAAQPSVQEIVTSTRWDMDPAITSDGSKLAFSSNRSGNTELWLSGAVGSGAVRVTRFQEDHISSPAWSPDGKSLVFEVHHPTEKDIYLVDKVGGTPRILASSGHAPVWSSDGSSVLFTSRSEGIWRAFRVDVEGGSPQPLPLSGTTTVKEGPDGVYLYYTRNATPGLWRSRTDGSGEELVAESLAPTDAQNWAIARNGVYFIERTSGANLVAFYDFKTMSVRTVWEASDPIPAGKASLSVSKDGMDLYITQIARLESDLFLTRTMDF